MQEQLESATPEARDDSLLREISDELDKYI
jgi:hypothetical protein